MDAFLPTDYAVPQGESKYMKFEQGDNKFRVLDKPIFGWLAWKEDSEGKHPVRFTMDAKPVDLHEYAEQRVTHFWAMPVWNINTKSIQVLEITQKSVQKAIEALARNEDWGSPIGYNITVKREGEKLNTEYFINPSPHTDLPLEAKQAYDDAKMQGFDIGRLYEGGDPFGASATVEDGEPVIT